MPGCTSCVSILYRDWMLFEVSSVSLTGLCSTYRTKPSLITCPWGLITCPWGRLLAWEGKLLEGLSLVDVYVCKRSESLCTAYVTVCRSWK